MKTFAKLYAYSQTEKMAAADANSRSTREAATSARATADDDGDIYETVAIVESKRAD